jgi:hypothetical protein
MGGDNEEKGVLINEKPNLGVQEREERLGYTELE